MFFKKIKQGFSLSKWPMELKKSGGTRVFPYLSSLHKTIDVPLTASNVRKNDSTDYLRIDLSGMTIKSDNPDLKISFSNNWNETLEVKDDYYQTWTAVTVPLNFNFSTTIPIKVESNPQSTMTTRIDVDSIKVPYITFDVGTAPGGCSCSVDIKELKERIRTELNKELPIALKAALSKVNFNSISVLAIKSILFPPNYMNLTKACIPGDMVIFGNLIENPRPL
jgi:hypothetical protein